MRLTRSLVFLTVLSALAIGVLRITFLSLSKSQVVSGCPSDLSQNAIDSTATVAFWQNLPLSPRASLASIFEPSLNNVLGSNSGDKWIEIDLSDQKLIAHQGNTVFLESLVSTGLWGRTPPGEYSIWYKIRATKMEGGSKALNTYYYLPNVPYAMFFFGNFGIHGTYWHNNFGRPMSHGCVNTPTPIAEKLYYWVDPQLPEGKFAVRSSETNPGTRVVIHE